MKRDFPLVERMKYMQINIAYKGFCSLHRNKSHLIRKRKHFSFKNSEFVDLKDKKPLDSKNLKLLLDI